MNYSQYYQKWLGVEFPEDRIPSRYEILGLMDAEPNLKSISNAIELALTRLQDMEDEPDAYAFLARQILKARQILMDPALKFEYDTQLLQGNGKMVWKSHRGAGLGERVRQFGLITVAFLMGMVVMFMMALTVKRNPDGSIIFREEARVQAALPFTTPLDGLVCRPAFASDFRENGYLVDIRGQATGIVAQGGAKSVPSAKNRENQNRESAVRSQLAQTESRDSESLENEFDALIPDDMQDDVVQGDMVQADAETETAQNAQVSDEIASLLPDGMDLDDVVSDDAVSEDAVSEETVSRDAVSENAPAVSEKTGSRRQSPLYGRIAENRKSSGQDVDGDEGNDSEESTVSKGRGKSLVNGVNSTAAQVAEESVSPENENASRAVADGARKDFSPQEMLELLNQAHEKIDKTDPKAEAVFTVIQGQTYLEIMKKTQEKALVLEADFLKDFTKRVLTTATDLGWEKHFEEAFQLCDVLREMGVNSGFNDEALAIIDAKKTTLQNYQARYLKSLEFEKILKENPDDPEANVGYAMWLWGEDSSVEGSVPYLAKARQSLISRAAQFEMTSREAGVADKDEYLLKAGDLWWEVSTKLNDNIRKNLVKEHAGKFYRKATFASLSDEQKLRLKETDGMKMSQK